MAGSRLLVMVVAALLALTLVAGTGGFSSVAADRSVEVAVAEDDEALVGLETYSLGCGDNQNGGNQKALRVRNQLGTEVRTIEAKVVDSKGGLDAHVTDTPGGLSVGEEDPVKVRVTPDGGGGSGAGGTISIELEVGGDGVQATLTREIHVDCPADDNGNQ